MESTILLVGRTRSVIDEVIAEISSPELHLVGATDEGGVGLALGRLRLDHAIIGGGLDVESRVAIVREILDRSAATTVHMNSRSGPESFLPFVRAVLHGLSGYDTRRRPAETTTSSA